MIDPYQAALAALIVLAGSTVLGTVGFGIAVTTSPLLLLFIEARSVVVMLNTVSVAVFMLMLFQTRNYLPLREMAPVAAAGVLGVPVGVFVLSSLDGPALRIGIAVIIILTTISLRLRLPAVRISPGLLGPAVGFVVAVLLPPPLRKPQILIELRRCEQMHGSIDSGFEVLQISVLIESVSVAGLSQRFESLSIGHPHVEGQPPMHGHLFIKQCDRLSCRQP